MRFLKGNYGFRFEPGTSSTVMTVIKKDGHIELSLSYSPSAKSR